MEVADGKATFPNGLVLRVHPNQISHQAVADACGRMPKPTPPSREVKKNGKVEVEENPEDPSYRAALASHTERTGWAAAKVMIVLGSAVEVAPENTPGVDEVDWDAFAYARDIPSPADKYGRYETWLRYYAFMQGYPEPGAGLREWLELIRYLAASAGLTMEAPAAITATFRDNAGRGADPAGGTVAAEAHGDVGRDGPAGGMGY